MDTNFITNSDNVFTLSPDSVDFGFKNINDNIQLFDYNNLTGFDSKNYSNTNGDIYNSQSIFPYQDNLNQSLNSDMNQNLLNLNDMNNTLINGNDALNQNMMVVSGQNIINRNDLNNTYPISNGSEYYYSNNSYLSPEQYYNTNEQYCNIEQYYKPIDEFKIHNLSETSLVEPGIIIGESNSSDKSSKSPNYTYNQNDNYQQNNNYQQNFYEQNNLIYGQNDYQQFTYYPYNIPIVQDNTNGIINVNDTLNLQNVQSNKEWNNLSLVNFDNLSDVNQKSYNEKSSIKDELESVANASTCESTPILQPSPSPSNIQFQLSTLSNINNMNNGYINNMNNIYGNIIQDMSETQHINNNNNTYYYPNYYQDYYNQTINGYNNISNNSYYNNDGLNESIIEIANEIANNVQYLPNKDSNGKYSLDKNHPIHCVWRDVNRGHCSWRCRWWENGKRLSKNFNVKRFGDFEAMRMAITMKIRNSTPVERIQLLKEQREAVRNQLHLYNTYPSNFISYNGSSNSENFSDIKITKVMNDSKKLQRDNWNRISWTYLKTNKLDNTSDSTIICRLCSKTTRCSRSRNLQQAHIMHLIRMHKNPWKQYLNPNGLTKMCKLALDSLYEQHQFNQDHQWNLRPGIQRPEPYFI